MNRTPRSKVNGLGASKNTKPEKIEHPRVNVDWQSVPPLMLTRKLRYKKRKSPLQLQEEEILKRIHNIKERI